MTFFILFVLFSQACVKFQCKDPCREPNPNVCGQGANCEVKNHKPICSCPRGTFKLAISSKLSFIFKLLICLLKLRLCISHNL